MHRRALKLAGRLVANLPRVAYFEKSASHGAPSTLPPWRRRWSKVVGMALEAARAPRLLLAPDAVVLPQVELVVTTHCTLRCRGCLHLIPELHTPGGPGGRHVPTKELLATLERLFDLIDAVGIFFLGGGEALLHPDAALLLDRLAAEPKVRNVKIWTNGTIVPDPAISARYETQYRKFVKIYPAVKALFPQIG